MALEDFKRFFACLQATYPFPREIGITTGVFTPQKKKRTFLLWTFSVNVTKSVGNIGIHIY